MAEPIIANNAQQVWEAIAQAQQPVTPPETIQAPSNAWPVSPMLETPTAPEAPTQWSSTLSLWGGKIVNKNTAQYKALIAKGMTDADIQKAYQEKNKPQTQGATVQNTPVKQNNWLDYQSVQPERKTEIVDNLNKFYGTNPEMFSDRNAFNTFFDYNDKRSPEQRQLLDSWYNQNITKKANASNCLCSGLLLSL